ncbi:uncharacterized protein N7503_007807 [Penicillium pulvis]|uniref:uncharacterized protein n=1 Tax=Penicillium pulvis TaxID=1562058 RepID=UPI0025479B4C|nr:uncharacterized protein N7503_007807 [Penicillium pulvis]KAJ5798511.1 hypothetical protein N7503_007807 [Penicillium pulvis]
MAYYGGDPYARPPSDRPPYDRPPYDRPPYEQSPYDRPPYDRGYSGPPPGARPLQAPHHPSHQAGTRNGSPTPVAHSGLRMPPVVPNGSLLSALAVLATNMALVVVPHLSLVTILLRALLLELMTSAVPVAMITNNNSSNSLSKRATLESTLQLVWLVWLSVDWQVLSLSTKLVCLNENNEEDDERRAYEDGREDQYEDDGGW